MNKLKPDLPLSDLAVEDKEATSVTTPDDSAVMAGAPSDQARTNGGDLEPGNINNNNNTSQAYGGARPKTVRSRLRNNNNSEAPSRSRTSEASAGVEIRVISCDGGPGESQSLDIALPRLESRQTSVPAREVEVEPVETLTEDDCYIYTYIGGTAYLSADLPNSFFRSDDLYHMLS